MMDAGPSSSPEPQSHRGEQTQDSPRQTDLEVPLWRMALHPGLLAVTALFVLTLVLASILLPQLPDQLQDEPAASARWLLTTATPYGAVGVFLRSTGLFDVLNSLIFRLGLALLTVIIAAHLADQIGNALALRRLRRNLCTLSQWQLGREMATVSRTLYQQRYAEGIDPVEAQDLTGKVLDARFDTVISCRHMAGAREDDLLAAQPAIADSWLGHRNLGIRNTLSYWLRPLLPLGLLAALATIWVFLFVGWELHSPVLAPGDTHHMPSHNVVLSYSIGQNTLGPQSAGELVVQVGSRTLTQTTTSSIRARLGASAIVGRSSEPALLIRVVDGAPVLAKPGQSELTDSVGVVLPGPGSEESLLLPGLSSGLRIVRRTDEPDSFFVELYQGVELRPQQRIEVAGPAVATMRAGDRTFDLTLVPVPGVEVTVRHMPGRWLLWIAMALSAIGFVGLLQPPAVAFTQISPWPVKRSVITIYSSEQDELNAVEFATGSSTQ